MDGGGRVSCMTRAVAISNIVSMYCACWLNSMETEHV